MPELPEVETIRRTLVEDLVGRCVQRVVITGPHVTGPVTPTAFRTALHGRVFDGVARRGKYLVFCFREDGRRPPIGLIAHLRMTGRMVYVGRGERSGMDGAHTHATFHLAGGGRLLFHDVRKFGRLLLVDAPLVSAHLPPGRDPLLDGLTPEDLAAVLGNRHARIKVLLLRQDLVAGLGNIYADESLHRAGLHPALRGVDISADGWRRLAAAIEDVLGEALVRQGTTLMDYRTGRGERGSFGAFLRVYGRAGEPCRACGTPIVGIRLGQRSTCFCPHCQPGDCV
jgi:formamidopyrimidine-DNA glycosylase